MTNHSHMHLGKRPRRDDTRTLKMARYLTGALPPAPDEVDYTRGVTDWGMMLNDRLGDCTIADGPGHATQVWTLNATGTMVTPPDSAILQTYEKWCGYNPADASTDQGGAELDVLNNWRQQGFNGHALDAYVAIELNSGLGAADSRFKIQDSRIPDPCAKSPATNATGPAPIGPCLAPNAPFARAMKAESSTQPAAALPDILTAIWLFGGAYIGVELPQSAQFQDVWDVTSPPGSPARHASDEPGSWGGHALYLVGYDFRAAGVGLRGSELGNDDATLAARSTRALPDGGGRGHAAADSTFNIQDSRTPGNHTESSVGRDHAAADSTFNIQDSRTLSAAQSELGNVNLTLTCLTWGKRKKMTWAWFEKYCSEAYALVSKDWLSANGVSPSGFDLATLESDLKLVTG